MRYGGGTAAALAAMRLVALLWAAAGLLPGSAVGAARTEGGMATAADRPGQAGGAPARLDPSAVARAVPPDTPKPLSVFTDAQGRPCQLYARAVTIGGEAETAYATVCRQPNGRWVLVQ